MEEFYCSMKKDYCTEKCTGKCQYKNPEKKKRNLFIRVMDEIAFFMTGKESAAVDDGIMDYSGQGRDRYGR